MLTWRVVVVRMAAAAPLSLMSPRCVHIRQKASCTASSASILLPRIPCAICTSRLLILPKASTSTPPLATGRGGVCPSLAEGWGGEEDEGNADIGLRVVGMGCRPRSWRKQGRGEEHRFPALL